MTGVDKDLATLRWAVETGYCGRDPEAALARVEAELSRLAITGGDYLARALDAESKLSRLREQAEKWEREFVDADDKREAAEARLVELMEGRDYEAWARQVDAAEARLGEAHRECARLQQALREIEVEEGHGETPAPYIVKRVREIAREALAGPGSEQSSLTESGSAGLPDTPADSRPSGWVCDREDCQGRPADSQEPRDESGYPGLQGLEAMADSQPRGADVSSPLDRIEARERVRANGQEMPWVLLTEDEMLALVNVAKAAENVRDYYQRSEGNPSATVDVSEWWALLDALCEALAALGKEPSL